MNNYSHSVMAGLDPAIHAFAAEIRRSRTWMPGIKPGMTADRSENLK
jgi:hypothetical protein